MQYRVSEFSYNGDIDFKKIKWSFLNPKVGFSYKLKKNDIFYLNIGKSGREPARYDMFKGMDVLAYLCEFDDNGDIIIPDIGNFLSLYNSRFSKNNFFSGEDKNFLK